jgi:hypothetical protein
MSPDLQSKSQPRCGRFGSPDTRPSRPRFWDHVLGSVLPLHAYRCRACNRRFRAHLKMTGTAEQR